MVLTSLFFLRRLKINLLTCQIMEKVLFVLTLEDELAQKYFYKKHGSVEHDANFYFLKPPEFLEYDPSSMAYIFESRVLKNQNVRLFVSEDVNLFSYQEGDLLSSVESALSYTPYVVLFRLRRDKLSVIEDIENVRNMFTDVCYGPSFDPKYDSVDELCRFSDFLPLIESFVEYTQPFLKDERENRSSKSQDLS